MSSLGAFEMAEWECVVSWSLDGTGLASGLSGALGVGAVELDWVGHADPG